MKWRAVLPAAAVYLLAVSTDLAAQQRVAVVAVSHLNKNAGGSVMYRTMGSLAFVAAARAVWAVVADAEDETQRRLLVPVKQNLSAASTGLAYRIVLFHGFVSMW